MAAITATDVVNVRSWRVPVPGATLYHRILDITLSSNGGTAADIPASLLGFKEILWAQSIRLTGASADLHFVPVVVEASGAGILTVSVEAATDNVRSDPANTPVDGTLRVLVVGIENN